MICIDEANLVAIKEHSQRSYPEECCGILLGKVAPDGMRFITELCALENRNPSSRENRFLIEAEDILRVEKEARQKGVELLGFYHSHPDCAARPSSFDLDQAWPWYIYIIVSVKQGYPDSLTCWQLNEDRSGFHAAELGLSTSEICAARQETSDA